MLAVFAKSMRADAPPLDRPSQRAIAREAVLVSPAAYVVRGFVAPEILEYMMALAARRLLPSMTFDPETGVPRRDDYRTSRTATLGPMDQDLTLVAVNQLLARIAGLPHARAEFLSVLKYDPGEEYRPHFDWIPPSGRDFNASGQRIRTALLYLNDDYEGGETHFLAPDFRFRGAPGDVLVFSNVGADGAPDQASRHASLPIRSGAKWLASKWFRERDFVF
jgi:prolyl 4-hydroxylase